MDENISNEPQKDLDIPFLDTNENNEIKRNNTFKKANKAKKINSVRKRGITVVSRSKLNKRNNESLLDKFRQTLNFIKSYQIESLQDKDEDEDDFYFINKYSGNRKFKKLLENMIKTGRTNEWNEYMKSYKKNIEESQSLFYRLKLIFHIESDFIVIWKTTLRIFNIFILFIFFFRYIFNNLTKSDSYSIQKRIIIIYYMINIMFFIDLIFSVLIIIFNGGSVLTYFKLPLKIYTAYPFELKNENFLLLLPKFIRIDIFEKIFTSWESFINLRVELYIHNFIFKLFIICITQLIKYLLIFGLYAHLNTCILSYFDEVDYASSLFYTIEAFTVVGYGERSPKTEKSFILVILNILIGVNLFSLMSSNIKNLSNKFYNFEREISLKDNIEITLFKIQKSLGKIMPSKLKEKIISYIYFRRGLSFHDIKEEYNNILDKCKNDLLDKIYKKLFYFLNLEYKQFFLKERNNDFIFEIFQNLKPKIFKSDKVLIKSGEKVNKIYFLLTGQIYASDIKNKLIFTMKDNSIFGDYEFITNTISCFNIKVDSKNPAFGFVLNKSNWEKISKRYILNANNFISYITNKRKKHILWINENLSRKNKFSTIIEESEEKTKIEKSSKEELNIVIDENNKNEMQNENIKKIIDSSENFYRLNDIKSPKYHYSNDKIIKDIDNLHKEINIIEFNFLREKELLLQNLKKCYL